MKNVLFFCLMTLPLIGISLQSGWPWAVGFGGTNGPDEVVEATLDPSGNICMTGIFQSQSFTLGTTTLTNTGQVDVLVAKFSPFGDVLWIKNFGGQGQDFVTGIATDSQGNIFICGYFNSTSISFGSTQLNGNGADDVFLAKLDPNGQVLWAKSAGSNGSEYARAVTTDDSGNAYMVGDFNSNSLSFGSTTLNLSVGTSDIFLAKTSSSGDVLWFKQSELDHGSSTSGAGDIVFGNDNSIIIGGSMYDNTYGTTGGNYIRFGTDSIFNNNIHNYNGIDYYYMSAVLAKFDLDGNFIVGYSDSIKSETECLAVDQNNNVYASVYYEGGIMISLPYRDFSIVKLEPNLNFQWRNDHTGGFASCTDLHPINNKVYATGYFSTTYIAFQTDTLRVESNGGHHYYEMFVTQFDANGNYEKVEQFGGSISDKGVSVLPVSEDDFYLIGNYESDTLHLGDKMLTNESDTGSFHVHVMPSWFWRHPNIMVAKYSDNYNGIAQYRSKKQIGVFPNPSSGFFNIEGAGIKSISLYTSLGKEVFQLHLANVGNFSSTTPLNLTAYPDGVYFLRAETLYGISTAKLIKH